MSSVLHALFHFFRKIHGEGQAIEWRFDNEIKLLSNTLVGHGTILLFLALKLDLKFDI